MTIASDNADVTVDTDTGTPGNQNGTTFAKSDWNQPRTVTVAAGQGDDASNNSAVLSHTAATGDYGGGGGGGGTVNVSGTARVSTNPAKAVRGWQVRFGRTVSHQVVDAVQGRFTANPQQPGLSLTVAGEEITSATPLAEQRPALSKALGFESVSAQQVAAGSAISFSPQAATEKGGGAPRLAVWGPGALSSFRGQSRQQHLP